MKKIGVDVSKYNGKINWEQAKKSGVQFAILRLGSGFNGGYIDKTFDYNYKECKRVGIPVGCYIASYCNIDKEIELTKQAIKNKQFEYPIYFDIEDFSIKDRGFTKSQITNLTVKFLSSLEKMGCYVGLYTNRAFLNSKFEWEKIKNYDNLASPSSKRFIKSSIASFSSSPSAFKTISSPLPTDRAITPIMDFAFTVEFSFDIKIFDLYLLAC